MKKATSLGIALTLVVATLLIGHVWLWRLSLDYNEQGRHFDAVNSVVYDEGAIAVYGILTAIFTLLAACSLFPDRQGMAEMSEKSR